IHTQSNHRILPTAIKEMERAAKQLGMRAIAIGTNVNGKNLDEPELFPVFERARDLGLLVYLHPVNVLSGKERLRSYHLRNLIGNPTETAIAIASIIFGGILERLPDLKLLFSHAGGTMPWLIGRHDHGYKVRPECQAAIPKPPSEYYKLIHFDTIAHHPQNLLHLVKTVGSDRVLLGSDYPADMADDNPVATVANLDIPETDKQKIWGGNAARLLNIGK
ncbi:amidohydrolase family protein, partial [Chloroflexota bacterium]